VTRDEAVALVRDKAEKETTVRHLISVEGVMRRLAQHFGEDQERWGLVGLFHDIDQDQTHDDPERHAYVGAEWLREAGVDEVIINGVLAHAHEKYRTDLPSKAIVNADAVAGFLVACALVRPEKTKGMKVSSSKKKLKERSFAPGVNRDEIHSSEENIGVPLDEFIGLGIEGLQSVAEEIELASYP
jgi:putative nucleotidyltransferase with HDIG domain